MSWLGPLWVWIAILYLILWHATKRFRWSDDVVLAFLIYTGTIARQIWWLFIAVVVVERVSVYLRAITKLKETTPGDEGLEMLVFRLAHEDRATLNRVVNDLATANEIHPAYPFRRWTKLWHAILVFLLQVGAYFLIQEVRQPGYLRTFFVR